MFPWIALGTRRTTGRRCWESPLLPRHWRWKSQSFFRTKAVAGSALDSSHGCRGRSRMREAVFIGAYPRLTPSKHRAIRHIHDMLTSLRTAAARKCAEPAQGVKERAPRARVLHEATHFDQTRGPVSTRNLQASLGSNSKCRNNAFPKFVVPTHHEHASPRNSALVASCYAAVQFLNN